jgi:hypothetical protein
MRSNVRTFAWKIPNLSDTFADEAQRSSVTETFERTLLLLPVSTGTIADDDLVSVSL